MATRTLGPGSLKVGATGSTREWAGDSTKMSITFSTNSEDDVPLLDGSNLSGEDTTTAALEGTIVDDYDFTSLQNFCLANAGKEMPFVFTPATKSGATDYGGVIRIAPINIGGDVKKKNTNDFSFKMIGMPTATKRA